MIYEARVISKSRASYLMGALGEMGGILLRDIHDEMICVQPIGSQIADGHLVATNEVMLGMRVAEQIGTDELAAIRAARERL